MSDHERFMKSWTKAQPVVAAYLNSVIPDSHAADDLLQETAVVLFRKIDEYEPSRPFVAWALGVARNEVLAARRAHARGRLAYHSDVMEMVADAYEEMAPELDERLGALRGCLQKVRGRERELVRLRYEESLKPGQIARRLSMVASTVRGMLTRIRDALAHCVDRELVADGRRP